MKNLHLMFFLLLVPYCKVYSQFNITEKHWHLKCFFTVARGDTVYLFNKDSLSNPISAKELNFIFKSDSSYSAKNVFGKIETGSWHINNNDKMIIDKDTSIIMFINEVKFILKGQMPIADANRSFYSADVFLEFYAINPCPNSWNINESISGNRTYQAAENIISSSNIGNSNLTFKAAKSISLFPGFKTNSNVIFKAIIGNCDN